MKVERRGSERMMGEYKVGLIEGTQTKREGRKGKVGEKRCRKEGTRRGVDREIGLERNRNGVNYRKLEGKERRAV